MKYNADFLHCNVHSYVCLVGGLSTAANALAIALQANDPHLDNFSLAILRLHENFFLANLKRKWWKTSQGCSKEHTSSKKNMFNGAFFFQLGITETY